MKGCKQFFRSGLRGRKMNIILLSGGSGKRLWPLSNDIRSKQFIKLFKTEDGQYESMAQRIYRQIRLAVDHPQITVATSKIQVSTIRDQLGEGVDICVEPCRRDTFPAIALAAAWLYDVKKLSEEEIVVACPIDSYVETDFFKALLDMEEKVKQNRANLVLMGIDPTYPSEKYGYIIPENKERFCKVIKYKEKPDLRNAKLYVEQGALWNGGVFCFKLNYIKRKSQEIFGLSNYEDLYEHYEALEKKSFDCAVVENEVCAYVMHFSGEWKDLGTWNTLTEAIEDSGIGKAIVSESCKNVHVVNELDVPVLCMGVKNIIVSSSSEGILVSDKEQSSYIKPYVEQIVQQIMFANKSWGEFRVLDIEDESMSIKATLKQGHRMSYHSHELRDEVWTIISGEGRIIVDGMEQPVNTGDVITIEAGCKHTIIADTELKIIEVQLGKEISAHDKKKYEFE